MSSWVYYVLSTLRYISGASCWWGLTRKLSYRKDDRAMRCMYGCPENFRESLTTPTATFTEIFNGLLFRLSLQMCVQYLNFVAVPVPEMLPEKNWAVPGYAHAPFSLKFLRDFCSDGPSECTGQIWNPYSFSRSWDNRGYPQKLGSPWIHPRFLFSKIFHGLLFGWTLWLFWPNLKFVAVPEIIAIGVLGGVRTPILGKGRP